MSIAISAHGLTKKYKEVTAVKNLDLEIPKGTIFGFLGPNGAGKTTTIRMLLGLIRPTAGSASVLGHDIRTEREAIVKRVGAIVESPSMYTYLTGIENLRVFARTSGLSLPDSQLHGLLDQVGLRGRETHKVKTYSLGMKQRLGIAATLLTDPEIIFLDEPTNGLDPAGTVEMRDMIHRLGEEGRTIFLSSHLLHEVEHVCSYVAIIQHGVTIAQGRVRDLLKEGSGYAIEAAPFERAMQILSAKPELNPISHDGHWITISSEAEQIPQVVRSLVEAKVDVFQVHTKQRSLESLFLELTSQQKLYVPQSAPGSQAVEVV